MDEHGGQQIPVEISLVISAIQSVQMWDVDGLFTVVEKITEPNWSESVRFSEYLFSTSIFTLIGREVTLDRIAALGAALEEQSKRVITPTPYLFERIIRRFYGEPNIVKGDPITSAILHCIVGSALLIPPEDLASATSKALQQLYSIPPWIETKETVEKSPPST